MSTTVETDFLVVGAGPSGASLASFMGQNDLKGILISSARGTADTPRAHAVNPFAIETLRDIGLEDECMRLGVVGRPVQGIRWARSMVGEEYGKVQAWGSHPVSGGEAMLATPCKYMDLPQSFMEPLLVKYATDHNFNIHFMTELVEIQRQSDGLLCSVRSTTTNHNWQIKTKYLFGADGARSTIGRAFPFTFNRQPKGPPACNVIVNVEISHLMQERQAQIHMICKPDRKWHYGVAPVFRMIRPERQYSMSVMGTPGGPNPLEGFTKESPELVELVKEMVGVDDIEPEIVSIDNWTVRETVADKYMDGRDVFLVGDAAHHHPPALGLGSNTCLQDSFNLGWKVAYVAKGFAGSGLLDTYNDERQPVGASIVREAMMGLEDYARVWTALGMFDATPEEGMKRINGLYDPTEAGVEYREALHKALEAKRREGESVGLGMNQWYVSGAIYYDDEAAPRPELHGDAVVKPLITTYPGNRIPHAWLDIANRRVEISTIDLAGHGKFCLIYGPGGRAWSEAAKSIAESTGIPIKAYGIGFGLDYIDVYRRWREAREIEDDGCILVRPDRYIAWRSMKMVPDCKAKLTQVLDKVLFRNEL